MTARNPRNGPPRGEASSGDRALVSVVVLVALGRFEALAQCLQEIAAAGVPRERVREALLQSHLFAGFPRMVEAFETWASVERRPPRRTSRRGASEARRGGLALFRRIYARDAGRVRRRLRTLDPLLERWVIGHAYGTVLARPALDARARELLAVGALLATAQWRQLASHLRGALRCGASPEEVRGALRDAGAHLPRAVGARGERLLASLWGKRPRTPRP